MSRKALLILSSALILVMALGSCQQKLKRKRFRSASYCWSNGGFQGTAVPFLQIEPTAGDRYDTVPENSFVDARTEAISTFSIDADGASYANIRRYIQQDKSLPPAESVRIEEMINYFDFDYPYLDESHAVNVNGEVSSCLWNPEHKLVRIGIEGKHLDLTERPPANFVFLIDVSGSMDQTDKLDLLKDGLKQLVDELDENDHVSIVTYSGEVRVACPSTSASNKTELKSAISSLNAEGSTAGGAAIELAYEQAHKGFIPGGNNRIIMGTDGDFNVGVSNRDSLRSMIEAKRDEGVFLTLLGFGRGNLNDYMMEDLSNHGNGTYEYIDHKAQIEKVFIYDYNKMITVAKDVKVQVEFNPNEVASYRLIGYENRMLETEDFEDDKKDAGELGSDQGVTALYEVVPRNTHMTERAFTIDLRYKLPEDSVSKLIEVDVFDRGRPFDGASDHMKFSAAIASYGMLLKDSEYAGGSNFDMISQTLEQIQLEDTFGFKSEFKDLVDATKKLSDS